MAPRRSSEPKKNSGGGTSGVGITALVIVGFIVLRVVLRLAARH